jgi:hypothetical protein
MRYFGGLCSASFKAVRLIGFLHGSLFQWKYANRNVPGRIVVYVPSIKNQKSLKPPTHQPVTVHIPYPTSPCLINLPVIRLGHITYGPESIIVRSSSEDGR